MRKIIGYLMTCMLISGMAYAKGGSWHERQKKHHYKEPVVVEAIGFRAEYQNGVVNTQWKKYLRDDLKYYKVVKSNTNPDPVYPDDGYVYYSNKSSQTAFADKKISHGTWYYRVRIITREGDRWVSPVVRIDIEQTLRTTPTAKDFE